MSDYTQEEIEALRDVIMFCETSGGDFQVQEPIEEAKQIIWAVALTLKCFVAFHKVNNNQTLGVVRHHIYEKS